MTPDECLDAGSMLKQMAKDKKRIAELERFAAWAKQYATVQARAAREAGADDLPWCKVVDQAEALTK